MHVCIQAVFGHFHVKVSHGLKFFRQQQVSCGKHAAGGVLLAVICSAGCRLFPFMFGGYVFQMYVLALLGMIKR